MSKKEPAAVARLALRELRQAYRFITSSREAALRSQLNAIKSEQFSWMLSVPKSVSQQAIKNRGAAFERFFGKQARYPKFKKKTVHDAVRLGNGPGTFKFEDACGRELM